MKPGKILYVINHIDWFWSHRLPLALGAKKNGWDVHVAVHGASKDPRFAAHGFTPHELPKGTLQPSNFPFEDHKPCPAHAGRGLKVHHSGALAERQTASRHP